MQIYILVFQMYKCMVSHTRILDSPMHVKIVHAILHACSNIIISAACGTCAPCTGEACMHIAKYTYAYAWDSPIHVYIGYPDRYAYGTVPYAYGTVPYEYGTVVHAYIGLPYKS